MATQQVHPMQVLHRGAKSDAARALQAATNRRLQRRGLAEVAIDEDGVVGGQDHGGRHRRGVGARRPPRDHRQDGRRRDPDRRAAHDPQPRPAHRRAEGAGQEARRAHARGAQAARGRRGAGGLGPQARRPGRPAGGGQLPRAPRGLPLPGRRQGQRGLPGADPERLALGLLAVRRGGLQGGRPAVPGDRRRTSSPPRRTSTRRAASPPARVRATSRCTARTAASPITSSCTAARRDRSSSATDPRRSTRPRRAGPTTT